MIATFITDVVTQGLYEYANHSLFLDPMEVHSYYVNQKRIRVAEYEYITVPDHLYLSVFCTARIFRSVVYPEIRELLQEAGGAIIDITDDSRGAPFKNGTKHTFELRCTNPASLKDWKDVPRGEITEWRDPDWDVEEEDEDDIW